MKYPMVSFRPGPLVDRLRAGRGVNATTDGAVAKRDLLMYYDLLVDALRTVQLEPGELALLIGVVNPVDRDPDMADHGALDSPLGFFSRGDARKYLHDLMRWQIGEDELGAKHKPTWQGLLDKIRSWDDLQSQSVLDALQQYRNLADPQRVPIDSDAMIQIGLLRPPFKAPDPELIDLLLNRHRRVAEAWSVIEGGADDGR